MDEKVILECFFKNYRMQSFLAMIPTPRTIKEWEKLNKNLRRLADWYENKKREEMNISVGIWWKTQDKR